MLWFRLTLKQKFNTYGLLATQKKLKIEIFKNISQVFVLIKHCFIILQQEKSGVALVAAEKFSEPREVEVMLSSNHAHLVI